MFLVFLRFGYQNIFLHLCNPFIMKRESPASISKKTDKLIGSIGFVLYKVRTEKGLTVEEVCDFIGVHNQTVYKTEANRSRVHLAKIEPRIATIIKMCVLYEIDFSDLIRRAEDINKSEQENGI